MTQSSLMIASAMCISDMTSYKRCISEWTSIQCIFKHQVDEMKFSSGSQFGFILIIIVLLHGFSGTNASFIRHPCNGNNIVRINGTCRERFD